ncbi:MAG: hypothetical protein Q8O30_00055 [Candidatus Omnitrophota bacterium]|nr:hypothetical protein [Candidatus Omnitrophota bacterium]
MKKVMIKILALFIIFIVSFIALESLFRLYRGKDLTLKVTTGKELNSGYDFEPYKDFELTSSRKGEFDVNVKINNFGFRGGDMKLEKTPGVSRIFMVGDSFTFGVGAEDDETIPYLTEKKLKDKGFNVEIINAGVGHRSPVIYYLKLRDNYLKFKPDAVVLLLDFSDLRDDWHAERGAVYGKDGEIARIDPFMVYGKRDWWGMIVRNSEVCTYVNNKLVRTFQKIKVLGFKRYIASAIAGKRAKAVIATSDNLYDKIDPIEYDGYLFMRGKEKLALIQKHWTRTEKYLLKIRNLLISHGIDFTLVMYPYGIHVGPDEWSEGKVYWGFEKGKVYTDRFAFDMVRDFCKDNSIRYVNTLDNFLVNKKPDVKFFFDLDGHMTPAGNRIVAECISSEIAEKYHGDYR